MNLFQKHAFHSQGTTAFEYDHSKCSKKRPAAVVSSANTLYLTVPITPNYGVSVCFLSVCFSHVSHLLLFCSLDFLNDIRVGSSEREGLLACSLCSALVTVT